MKPNRHAVRVGDELHLSAAASLLLIGHYAYEDFIADAPDKRNDLHDLVDEVLAAARTGGFARSDLLRTLMSKHEESPRMLQLAQEAVNFMGGDEEFVAFMCRATEKKEGDTQ